MSYTFEIATELQERLETEGLQSIVVSCQGGTDVLVEGEFNGVIVSGLIRLRESGRRWSGVEVRHVGTDDLALLVEQVVR